MKFFCRSVITYNRQIFFIFFYINKQLGICCFFFLNVNLAQCLWNASVIWEFFPTETHFLIYMHPQTHSPVKWDERLANLGVVVVEAVGSEHGLSGIWMCCHALKIWLSRPWIPFFLKRVPVGLAWKMYPCSIVIFAIALSSLQSLSLQNNTLKMLRCNIIILLRFLMAPILSFFNGWEAGLKCTSKWFSFFALKCFFNIFYFLNYFDVLTLKIIFKK